MPVPTSARKPVSGVHEISTVVRAPSAANEASYETTVRIPCNAKIRRVLLVAAAAITGADTNTRHINLINKGTDGSGTTELAAKDFVSGTNAAKAATVVLYSPASPLSVADGTVLSIQSELIGTGQVLPNLTIVVEFFSR